MQTSNTKIIKNVTLAIFCASLPLINTAWAESDMKLQEKALMARELSRQQASGHANHAEHQQEADESTNYRGVFFGYLPCKEKDCDGLKMTLSLKQKSNYLLVSQYAKASSREYYDKGKYVWDDQTHTLSLTSNKDDLKRKFSIKDEGTLTLLNSDGKPLPGNQDDYTLSRSDKAKSREVHIH
jgi:hypothetical protein